MVAETSGALPYRNEWRYTHKSCNKARKDSFYVVPFISRTKGRPDTCHRRYYPLLLFTPCSQKMASVLLTAHQNLRRSTVLPQRQGDWRFRRLVRWTAPLVRSGWSPTPLHRWVPGSLMRPLAGGKTFPLRQTTLQALRRRRWVHRRFQRATR